MAASTDYSLALLGRFAGKDRAVAQALATAFGRDAAWGLQVVGASPITIFTNLTEAQALAIHAALHSIEESGCLFQVNQGIDDTFTKVNWPAPPSIFGRPLSSFLDGSSGAAHLSNTDTASATSIKLACPYTGKPLLLNISLTAADDGGLNVHADIRSPEATQPAIPAAVAAAHGAMQIPVPMHIQQVQIEPDLEPLDALEEILPAPPRTPAMKMRTQPSKPLPEVPVVDPEPIAAAAAPPLPGQRFTGVIELKDFEANLAKTPRPLSRAPQPEPIESGQNAESNTLCSIFIGKSNNSKVHDLVADIQGISVKDAQKICQKAVVPVVKDIPMSEANAIKERFKELNVNARIMPKR